MTWVTVCTLGDIPRDGAVAVLVGDEQVGVVRLADDTLFAVSHRDPVSGANVMARGLVGSATVDGVEVPTITSPMFKQTYDLRDGRCLTDRCALLTTWDVRLHGGDVQIGPARVATDRAAATDDPTDSEVTT
ncbi:nitrite reductase small subunit NirD [Flexivirga sp. B27]